MSEKQNNQSYEEQVSFGEDTMVASKNETSVSEPPMFKVLLHNDDYTPMDFVVEILQNYFNKNKEIASKIMLDVHEKGVGVCGVFPFEIAETKQALVSARARQMDFPLKCTMEEE
ncbi:MAG: ATP-dependent Clp protease adapter ClpS [Zetaproteobacteria bacterium]|mgnify:CR=1 FL=1|nr:ATP-dependent Clp protease adapter ClpS [Pseudobdellovibrionaceae bacterium]|tara:strand:- start:2068 stop:2412 length:345 start_codon:yes stop_codon:yes gene_type:complete